MLIPLGSSGDVHPFIGVGRELARRGHAVTLVAAGWFRDVVERAGLGFVDPLPDLDFAESIRDEQLWHPLHGARLVLEMLGRPLLEPVYRIVERTSLADLRGKIGELLPKNGRTYTLNGVRGCARAVHTC